MSHTPTIPSRRGLLTAATAALAAGTVIATAARGAPVASAGGVSDDAELIVLYQRWLHAIAGSEAASDRAGAIRERLVRIYGRAGWDAPAPVLWGHDPAYPTLLREVKESDRLAAESDDLADEIFALDAGGIAGVLVKVRIAIECADPPSDETSYPVEIAIVALKEVERVLEALTGRATA